MSQIKFRAKQIDNGEWVYGHYYTNGYPKPDTLHYIQNGLLDWVVDESTLGQFTGECDRYKKEIMGGDIINLGGVTNYEVKFIRGGFAIEFNDGHRYIGQFAEIKVIGNVTDNKELLS